MNPKIKVAIIGPGNIGTDLMYKIRRSRNMDLALMTGIKPDSEGLALADRLGIPTSLSGIDAILENDDVRIVFDSTGARPHSKHAPMLKEAGEEMLNIWATLNVQKRIGDPAELKGVVVFLASDAASYITGHILVADGGYLIW